jgi:hypothetical protein
MKEEMKTYQAEMKATVSVILQEMKSQTEETKDRPEKRKAIAEELEVVTERQQVPNKEAAVEIIGVVKDRSGDQWPAVGCRYPLKRRTKENVLCGKPKGLSRRDVWRSRYATVA